MHSDDLGLVQQPKNQFVEARLPGAVASIVQAQRDSHTSWTAVMLLASDLFPSAIVWCGPRGPGGSTPGVFGQLLHCLIGGHVNPSISVAPIDGDDTVSVP